VCGCRGTCGLQNQSRASPQMGACQASPPFGRDLGMITLWPDAQAVEPAVGGAPQAAAPRWASVQGLDHLMGNTTGSTSS
jgi:hypothetical protein